MVLAKNMVVCPLKIGDVLLAKSPATSPKSAMGSDCGVTGRKGRLIKPHAAMRSQVKGHARSTITAHAHASHPASMCARVQSRMFGFPRGFPLARVIHAQKCV